MRRFSICAAPVCVGVWSYSFFNDRITWAYDKKRFVYANMISETAENNKEGVVKVSSSIRFNRIKMIFSARITYFCGISKNGDVIYAGKNERRCVVYGCL